MSSESGIEQEKKYMETEKESRIWLGVAALISIGIWGVIIYLLMGVSNEAKINIKAVKDNSQTVNSKSSR